MRIIVTVFSLVITFFSSFGQILINNVNVVDVEKQQIFSGQTVLIQNEKISYVGKDIKFKLSSDTKVIDGTGKYLMPGLTDAHVHFFQSGGLFARPDVIDLRKHQPYDKEIKWTQDNMPDLLSRYLSAGITTVIDVGSTINFLNQRNDFLGSKTTPEIHITGPLLTTWIPEPYKNLGDNSPFTEMVNEEQVRKSVREQVAHKADFIKIWYIVRDTNIERGAKTNLPLVKAAIDEAHKNNLRVAVHATERITAHMAVSEGADFLVHNIDDEVVDAAFLRLLKEKNTVLCPTMVVAGNYGKVLGDNYHFDEAELMLANPTAIASVIDYPWPDTSFAKNFTGYFKTPAAVARQKETDSVLNINLKKMLDAGITIATGTDAGNIGTQHASSYMQELKAMQHAGFSNWQLLQASTINGAKALNKQKKTGSVSSGKTANLLLLNANPALSLDNWIKIDYVINKGNLIKPDTLINHTPAMLAQEQLNAYNAHNLEAFLAPYAEDVEIFDFPNRPGMKGKEEMRKAYQFITQTPALYCKLLNRIVQGNTVIDHEEVYGFGPKPVHAIAIYIIEKGKIKKVYFRM